MATEHPGRTLEPQRRCDQLFTQLQFGEITRREYVRRVDEVYPEYVAYLESRYDRATAADLRTDLDRRRDRRPLGRFALMIYDATAREAFLAREWVKLLHDRGVSLEDFGFDNEGRLALASTARARRADFRVTIDGVPFRVEVKFCPTQSFATYKLADLENYIASGAWVLTILGDARMVGPNGDPDSTRPLEVPRGLRWSFMGPDDMAGVVGSGERGRHKGFGGKPTVRVYKGSINLKRWARVRNSRGVGDAAKNSPHAG